ncbi:MAG: gliding motility-associated protein GldE [Flavobacteriaceae bacterium]|nr:gliding motility-associated protein GldE [Flavobacteriaceae bacterium]MBT6127070.1 gliding motility-associated protein GldE [Flavobacteriaceae bacterium]
MDPDPFSFLIAILDVQGSLVIQFILLLLLLITSGLVSGAEVAFFSLTKEQLDSEDEKKSRQLEIIRKMLQNPKRLLATILITNNFINIAIVLLFASLGESLFSQIENPLVVLLIEIGVITFLILFFGEILPKVYANRNAMTFSKAVAFPIYTIDRYFLFFLTIPMSRITRFMESRLAQKNNEFSIDKLSQALELTSEEETTKEEHKILQGIVSFGNTDTKQIMCPRIDVFALSEDMDMETIVPLILEKGFSRVPVYTENIDSVVGILYTKDLLPHLEQSGFKWKKLLKPVFYVPENKKLDDLLREFQQKKIHLAVVVDEYGGTSGVITLEDVIEEIVGDISDEFDDDELIYSKLDDFTFVFDAKINLKDFYKVIDLGAEEIFEKAKGESESIAGFVLEIAQAFPKVGQVIQFEGYQFVIESVDRKRIKRIKVILPPSA